MTCDNEDKWPDMDLQKRLLAYGIIPRRNLTRLQCLSVLGQILATRLAEVFLDMCPGCDIGCATVTGEELEAWFKEIKLEKDKKQAAEKPKQGE